MQNNLNILLHTIFKLFYAWYFLIKLALAHSLIEYLIQLLQINDLFLSKYGELSFDFFILNLFLYIKQKNFAHDWLQLIGNGSKNGKEFFFILKSLPLDRLFFKKGLLLKLIDVGYEGGH